MTNMFFAGCESLMEDDTVEAEAKVTITPEEQAAEVAEAEEQATEQAETTAEVEQGAQQTELAFRKFDEIDRMIKHVETFGVDKTFLFLCNHNNILNKSFGLGLPAVESFDDQPSPYSAVSQAAMEGLKEAASAVWEFIKRMLARAADWIVRIVKMYDVRILWTERRIKKTRNIVNWLKKDEFNTGESDKKVYTLKELSDHMSALITMETEAEKQADKADSDKESDDIPQENLKEKAKLGEAKTEVKKLSLSDVQTGYLKLAEEAITKAKQAMGKIGTLRKTVASLNTKVRTAEKTEDAKKYKKKVMFLNNAIKLHNRSIGSLISDVAGNAITAAAAAAANSKKSEEKKEEKSDKKK